MDHPLPPDADMKRLLSFLGKHGASDLHLKVGYPPYVRIGGYLRQLQLPPIADTGRMTEMLRPLVPGNRWTDFETRGSLDFSAADESGDRYRINIYRSMGDMHVAVRRVQSKILDFNELNLPEIYREMISKTMEGLILVCGVTGSGKSSTLAAMIEYINHQRSMHIITIEDPIEFRFYGKKMHHFAARNRTGRAEFPRRAAGGRAAGSGLHSDRRNARPRNDVGRDPGRRDWPPGDGVAALRRRAVEFCPHPRIL